MVELQRKIKSITTVFDGVKYRSRTEARWALFLFHLGAEFDYEPEGYSMPSGKCYLPDFYVYDFDAFIEVKPNNCDIILAECEKFGEFAKLGTSKHYWIAIGRPSFTRNNLLIYRQQSEEFEEGFLNNDFGHIIAEDRRDERYYWLADMQDGEVVGGRCLGGPGVSTDHDRPPLIHNTVKEAYELVKTYKF